MREVSSTNMSLIDGLAESLEPVSRRRAGREAAILAGIAALQVAGTLAVLWPTAAAVFAGNPAGLAAKALLLAAVTLGFGALALRSLNPAAPRQKTAALAIGAAAAVAAALIFDWEFGGGAAAVLMPQYGWTCLLSAVSFSIPMFFALTVFMRGGASTRPRMTALFVGIASGSWGVFVYGLQCPFMNIAYMAAWYGGAIALVTAAAAFILPRAARW